MDTLQILDLFTMGVLCILLIGSAFLSFRKSYLSPDPSSEPETDAPRATMPKVLRVPFCFIACLILFSFIPLDPRHTHTESIIWLFSIGVILTLLPTLFLRRFLFADGLLSSWSTDDELIDLATGFLMLAGGILTIFLNIHFDSSAPTRLNTEVSKIEKVQQPFTERKAYYMRIHFQNPHQKVGSTYLDLSFYPHVYNELKDKPLEVSLKVHKGYLGFTWYSDVDVHPNPGDNALSEIDS